MSDAELRDHSFEAQEGRWLRFGAWTDGDTPRVVFVVGAEMTSKGAAKAALERGQLVLKHRVWDALARGQRHVLFRRDEARRAGWLVVQSRVRRDLRAALDALVPGERVWIFGSLTQPGRFNDASDVDVALEADRKGPRIPDPGPRSSDGARRAVTGKRSRREAIARLARLSRACQGDDRVALGDRQADVFVVSPVKLRGLTG